MITCDQCKKRAPGPGHRTVTDRLLCDDCHDQLLGAAAGLIAVGPTAPLQTKISSAIATSGFFAALRRRREERRSRA